MRNSRLTTIVFVLALALAAPLASTAPVTALGETLADLSTGLMTSAESKFGAHHRYASRRLTAGMRGTDVATLQRLLTEAGLETAVNGVYGPDTRSSVRRWEAWCGRRPDGRLSPREARRVREEARSSRRWDAHRDGLSGAGRG